MKGKKLFFYTSLFSLDRKIQFKKCKQSPLSFNFFFQIKNELIQPSFQYPGSQFLIKRNIYQDQVVRRRVLYVCRWDEVCILLYNLSSRLRAFPSQQAKPKVVT